MLFQTIDDIHPGDQQLVKLKVGKELKELAVEASEFKVSGELYKLVSLQNITYQLDENETVAWQKLIRVLTHEIMNSVSPITSLTDTLHHIVKQKLEKKETIDQQTLGKIDSGLMVINDRSKGLVSFTEAYKNLTRIPAPNFKNVNLKVFQEQLTILFKAKLSESGIQFQVNQVNPDLKVLADPELLSQVLINLLKNAIEALALRKAPCIWLDMRGHGEKSVINYCKRQWTRYSSPGTGEYFYPIFHHQRKRIRNWVKHFKANYSIA